MGNDGLPATGGADAGGAEAGLAAATGTGAGAAGRAATCGSFCSGAPPSACLTAGGNTAAIFPAATASWNRPDARIA